MEHRSTCTSCILVCMYVCTIQQHTWYAQCNLLKQWNYDIFCFLTEGLVNTCRPPPPLSWNLRLMALTWVHGLSNWREGGGGGGGNWYESHKSVIIFSGCPNAMVMMKWFLHQSPRQLTCVVSWSTRCVYFVLPALPKFLTYKVT